MLLVSRAAAGPYAPAAGKQGSTAVYKEDASIVAWATGWTNYQVGAECLEKWQTPTNALGPASGDALDIVCLGDHGRITMKFKQPIPDGPGYDLAVFENGFSDTDFLELGYCEVSSDGTNFFRFESHSLTDEPIPFYNPPPVDPTDLFGLAGKYRQGYGTPFDLAEIDNPALDKQNVRYVRIVDIVGDGSCTDSSGNVIYDPYPTGGSAGFDLDAVAVLSNDTQEVSVSAGNDAAEWGPATGTVVVTRKSWNLQEPLAVEIGLSGTASNGVDYAAVDTTVTIPAGTNSASISFIPIEDSLAEGEEEVSVTLLHSEDYLLGQKHAATIALADRPLSGWQKKIFGEDADSPEAAPDGDWDGDGSDNLLEYALGTDPRTPGVPPVEIFTRVVDGATRVCVAFEQTPGADDVEVVLESAETLSPGAAAAWQTVEYSTSAVLSADGSKQESITASDDSRTGFFKLEARQL